MVRHVKQGAGWRLGWDSKAIEFKGLVGGEAWALELTEAEFSDFCRLVTQLTHTIEQLRSELMAEEKISCELESDLLWIEAEGYADRYDLHFILLTGRRGEGSWPASIVPELLQAIQTLNVF
jgi:hypothetical protein